MRALSSTCLFAVLLGAAVEACTVPVFRFALDRWPADAYRLEAPESWIESAAGKAFEEDLAETETKLVMVPTEGAGAPARLLMADGNLTEVWSGELTAQPMEFFDSPARAELAKRILAGDSMVWVHVSGKDETANKAFRERLKTRLEYLESVAAIPEQDPNDPESQLGPGPELRVGFSLLEVKRDDPKEQVFLKMLAGPEGNLLTNDEPFGGVVFGRGRVLGAWRASDLDEEGIDEVSLFLLGACSCQVKLQNPGWDLAMAVDWDTRLMEAQMIAEKEPGAEGRGDDQPASKAGLGAIVVEELETVSFEGGPAVGTKQVVTTTGSFNLLWVAVAAAVAGLFFIGFLAYRKSG